MTRCAALRHDAPCKVMEDVTLFLVVEPTHAVARKSPVHVTGTLLMVCVCSTAGSRHGVTHAVCAAPRAGC